MLSLQLSIVVTTLCMMHKLPKLLAHFDPSKSEVQNMHDNWYYRIFDCGNYVFEKVYA